jgi:hypothetical protein
MNRLWLAAAVVVPLYSAMASAHGVGANGLKALSWHSETISRVVSSDYSWNNLGVTAISASGALVEVDGDACLRGQQFNLDVSNEYGFDLDEEVTLSVEIDLDTSGPDLSVAYDRSGGPGFEHESLVGTGRKRVTFTLPRARFADRGDHSTDIMLAGQAGRASYSFDPRQAGTSVTICDITLVRSFKTKMPETNGWLELDIVDETGAPAAIRAGLYDSSGRAALPSDDAVAIKKFSQRIRTLLLTGGAGWPSDNRFVNYISGRYRVSLPPGRYRLLGIHGIEYRAVDETIVVPAGSKTAKTIRLQRFANLPAGGWYSGDVHIHLARRDARDGRNALAQVSAEDLHVGNLLEMGNLASSHFPQAGWGKDAGRLGKRNHTVVSGQEDPRTSFLGHTIHLNLDAPVRFPDTYLLYHRVFEAVSRQGGVSGFAHVGFGRSETRVGMAMNVPLGHVKFAEVAQGGMVGTDLWFDFLNLGYRIAPAAGTDYPYLSHPGAMRSYVHLPDGYSTDAWFDGLAAGRTFVTNGPLLEFSINGAGPGEQVDLGGGGALESRGTVRLNPDLGELDRVELIVQGEVVATVEAEPGANEVKLDHRLVPASSTWLVLRGVGHRRHDDGALVSITAPVYVAVDGETRTWKRSAVPNIVEGIQNELDRLQSLRLEGASDVEWFETGPAWKVTWSDQIAALAEHIATAKAKLAALAKDAESP